MILLAIMISPPLNRAHVVFFIQLGARSNETYVLKYIQCSNYITKARVGSHR